MESEAKKLTTAEQSLTQKLSSQKQDLTKLKQEYVNAAAQYGKNSSEAKSLGQQIKTLSGQIASEEKADSPNYPPRLEQDWSKVRIYRQMRNALECENVSLKLGAKYIFNSYKFQQDSSS